MPNTDDNGPTPLNFLTPETVGDSPRLIYDCPRSHPRGSSAAATCVTQTMKITIGNFNGGGQSIPPHPNFISKPPRRAVGCGMSRVIGMDPLGMAVASFFDGFHVRGRRGIRVSGDSKERSCNMDYSIYYCLVSRPLALY